MKAYRDKSGFTPLCATLASAFVTVTIGAVIVLAYIVRSII